MSRERQRDARGERKPTTADAVAARLARLAFAPGSGEAWRDVTIRPLAGRAGALPDSPSKFVVVQGAGDTPVGFAHVSPPALPDVVARDVAKILVARDALGDELGPAVLLPLAHDAGAGLTAALYPFCTPLAGGRWAWRLQRPLVRRWGLRWLRGVARRTSRPVAGAEIDEAFARPLECLAAMQDISSDVRTAARAVIARLGRSWQPRQTLMHGDFWKGNVVVRRSRATLNGRVPWSSALAVIDWGTSAAAGYGVFDLVRFAESMALSSAALRSEIVVHARLLECNLEGARGHLLAALGSRAMHLECFPRARFAAMAASCLRTFDGSA